MKDRGYTDWWDWSAWLESQDESIERTADCALRYLEELLEKGAYDEVREIIDRISLQLPRRGIPHRQSA